MEFTKWIEDIKCSRIGFYIIEYGMGYMFAIILVKYEILFRIQLDQIHQFTTT